jgi:hypothetical protein
MYHRRVDAHRGEREVAARPGHRAGPPQLGHRIRVVLEGVPHGHHREMGAGQRRGRERAAVHLVSLGARRLRGPAARLDPGHRPSPRRRHVEEDAGVAAHVEQGAARRHVALEAIERAPEGHRARGLVLEVDGVLDRGVVGEDRRVVLAGAPEPDAAAAARHDLPEGAVVEAGAGHEAGALDTRGARVTQNRRDLPRPAERAGHLVELGRFPRHHVAAGVRGVYRERRSGGNISGRGSLDTRKPAS